MWSVKEKTGRTLESAKNNFWRRACRKFRKDRVPNKTIKKNYRNKREIINDIKTKHGSSMYREVHNNE